MKITVSKILNKTDLAQSGSHGGLVVTKAEKNALMDFFDGARQEKRFTDITDNEEFMIHYQDYTSNGKTPSDRITPIGKYSSKHNLKPGDVLFFEKEDLDDDSQYMIRYSRKLSSVFFKGKARNTVDVLNNDQLSALFDAYLNEGVIKKLSETEFEMPVIYLGIEESLIIRKLTDAYEFEINDKFIGENNKYFELDMTASPFLLKKTGTWTVAVSETCDLVDYNNAADDELINELTNFVPAENVNYSPIPEQKSPKKEYKGKMLPARNKQKSQNALTLSGYKCEIGDHETFIRKSNGLPYTEPHHLIPLQFDDLFEYSLDVEANIVSLCSNCHNNIHYGINAEGLIRKLWNERESQIHAAGIGTMKNGVTMTIEILLSFYGI